MKFPLTIQLKQFGTLVHVECYVLWLQQIVWASNVWLCLACISNLLDNKLVNFYSFGCKSQQVQYKVRASRKSIGVVQDLLCLSWRVSILPGHVGGPFSAECPAGNTLLNRQQLRGKKRFCRFLHHENIADTSFFWDAEYTFLSSPKKLVDSVSPP